MDEATRDDAIVAKLVKQRDRDVYVATLFAPPTARPDLLAVYAFANELARVPAMVSEPMPGEIRLQWWRDAISAAEPGRQTGNPVADAFIRALLKHDLPKEHFIRMIDARTADLYAEPFSGMDEFRLYMAETSGLVFEIAARILGGGTDHQCHAKLAGLAYGITQILPPAQRYEFSTPELLAMEAETALGHFRAFAPKIETAVRPAFLPLALVPAYLRMSAASGYDSTRAAAILDPMTRFWYIWRAAISGRI